MRDISKIVEEDKEKSKKPKTIDEIYANIIMADFELMKKMSRNNGIRMYPDPVEPQWKN
jgi:hypothetical protein